MKKNAFFNSSSVRDFSAKIVQTCGRYESKFILEGGILAAKFDPMLIKNSLNLSAIILFISN